MKYLLDTNVLKEIGKPNSHENVAAWLDTMDDLDLAISVISVREIWKGIERKRSKDAVLATRLEVSVHAIVAAFHDRVLPINEIIAQRWGILLGQSEKNADDAGLAATAHAHDLVIVTRNEADFQGRSVSILNPFKSPPKLTRP